MAEPIQVITLMGPDGRKFVFCTHRGAPPKEAAFKQAKRIGMAGRIDVNVAEWDFVAGRAPIGDAHHMVPRAGRRYSTRINVT